MWSGDGVVGLAVGAVYDDDGGVSGHGVGTSNRGAVYILYLKTDGTVKGYAKISPTVGGFTGVLDDNDHFGSSVVSLGDLDGDGQGLTQCTAHAVRHPSVHCRLCAPCVVRRRRRRPGGGRF